VDADPPALGGIDLPFETDQHPARLGEVFPPATIERRRALKRELDPRNLFRDNFNVDPGGTPTDAAPTAAAG
jgi:hypothetical protein